MQEILGHHGFRAPARRQDGVLALGDRSQGQDAVDAGAMNLLGQVHSKSAMEFEAADPGLAQAAFDVAGREASSSGAHDGVEHDDGTPALLGRAGDEVVQIRAVCEAQLAEWSVSVVGSRRARAS